MSAANGRTRRRSLLAAAVALGTGAAIFIAAATGPAGPRPAAADDDAPAPHLTALWEKARAAYEDERWADAANALEALVTAGFHTPALHYDLGNALYHLGRYGHAIVSYERALLMEPGAADVEENLLAAERAALAAAGEDPAAALGRAESSWSERLVGSLTADAWTLLFATVWLAGFAALTTRRLVARAGMLRSIALAVSIAGLSLAPLAGAGLWARATLDAARDRAVVVADRATLRHGPSGDHPPAFDVRQGIRVTIVGEDAGWLNVRLTDGLQGWVPPGAAERI